MAFPSPTRNHAQDLLIIRTRSFAHLSVYLRRLILFVCRFSGVRFTAFWIQLCYFVSLVLLGSLVMMLLPPSNPDFRRNYVDMLFMSTSASTMSGLGTVEMEGLSSAQILVLTVLMLFGGEAFVGLLGLGLRLRKVNDRRSDAPGGQVTDGSTDQNSVDSRIESGLDRVATEHENSDNFEDRDLKGACVRSLTYVVLGYIVLIHVAGTLLLFMYVSLVSSAKNILKMKGIHLLLFAFSSTVSSFANCGLIPTNENMAIFSKNPGLLLLIVPQILAGNTLFPLFIRLVIWALQKVTRAQELKHLLKHSGVVPFHGLLPSSQTAFLSFTVVGFIAAQVALLCALNWYTAVFAGLNSYQKLVSSLFMAANTRHAGETSIDPSLAAPAVLVLYIVMMYLPSSTSFSPVKGHDASCKDNEKKTEKRSGSLVENLMLSQTSYLVVFVMLICITEKRKLSRDPLNFSTLNIIFEVTSGYGNVGLSTGYSCSRLRKLDPGANCADKPYSFAGWWSDEGKLILIFVMVFGRLKKFSAHGGRAWKLY